MSRKIVMWVYTQRLSVYRWLERWTNPHLVQRKTAADVEASYFKMARYAQLAGSVILIAGGVYIQKLPFILGGAIAWAGPYAVFIGTKTVNAFARGESAKNEWLKRSQQFSKDCKRLLVMLVMLSVISCWLISGESAAAEAVRGNFPKIGEFAIWWVKQVNCLLNYLGWACTKL